MPKEPLRILAINPGSRYIGIAAFRGPELLDWGVKVVTGKTAHKKLASARIILLDLLWRYHPDALAIKWLHRSRSSRQLNEVASTIKQLARRRGIRVRQYSIQDIKNALCAESKSNKRKLAEVLVALHPALAHELQQETQSRNPYHVRMFEAVALAVICNQQLEEEN